MSHASHARRKSFTQHNNQRDLDNTGCPCIVITNTLLPASSVSILINFKTVLFFRNSLSSNSSRENLSECGRNTEQLRSAFASAILRLVLYFQNSGFSNVTFCMVVLEKCWQLRVGIPQQRASAKLASPSFLGLWCQCPMSNVLCLMQIRSPIWKLCCIPQKRTPSKVESDHHRRELETLFPHFQSSLTTFPFFSISHKALNNEGLNFENCHDRQSRWSRTYFHGWIFFHVKQSDCKLKCVGCENVYIGCEKVVFMCFIPLKSIFALFWHSSQSCDFCANIWPQKGNRKLNFGILRLFIISTFRNETFAFRQLSDYSLCV